VRVAEQRTHTGHLVRVSLRPPHSGCQLGLAAAPSDASAGASPRPHAFALPRILCAAASTRMPRLPG